MLIAFRPALWFVWTVLERFGMAWLPPGGATRGGYRGAVRPHGRRSGPAHAGHERTPCGALPARSTRTAGAAMRPVPASGVSGRAGARLGRVLPSPRQLAAEPTSYPSHDSPHKCGLAQDGVQSGRPQVSVTRQASGTLIRAPGWLGSPAASGSLAPGSLDVGPDVDAPAGELGGEAGILPLLADREAQLVVGHDHARGTGRAVDDLDGLHPGW